MMVFTVSAAPALLLACSICFSVPVISLSLITAPTNPEPMIVLVPAAWFSPFHYVRFTDQLRLAGYETVSQRLPSCDSVNPKAQSMAVDSAFIVEQLLMPSINAGKEVVLMMHSYGGGPGAAAAKGISVTERRAAGKSGGIIGLIFISAFIAEEGQSLLSSGGGKYPPWVIQYNDGQLGVRGAKDTFFNDVPRPLSDLAITELRIQSRYWAETPCGAPAWSDAVYDGRRAYMFCTLDHAIPLARQEFMIKQSKVLWDVETFHTGHAPFLSQPKTLSDWTVNEIAKFKAADG